MSKGTRDRSVDRSVELPVEGGARADALSKAGQTRRDELGACLFIYSIYIYYRTSLALFGAPCFFGNLNRQHHTDCAVPSERQPVTSP